MPNEETTTKLKVDITDLKKAMQEAVQSAKLADSEFQKVASTCDDWSKSSDGISAKIKSLNSNLDSQKAKLSLLEAQYDEVVAAQGKGSKAAQDLEIKMNKQQATINKTEREIDGLKGTLGDVTKAEKIAADTGKEVSEVLDDMGDSAEGAEGGFSVLKGSLATFAGNAMSSFAGAIKDGIMNIAGLADETREYRNEMSKLDTAFATNGHNAEAARGTYEELYSVLGDEGQAVEASNFLAKLTDNEKELANWTNIATGVYGQFGSSLPIEGLAEAANETAKVGQVTGPLADALNWTGVSAEQLGLKMKANTKENEEWNKAIKEGASSEDLFNMALSECSTEQERQQLIMKTLNGLYSESADAFRESNSEVMEANRAQSALTDAQARLGAVAEPVVTTVKQGFADLLSTLLDLVGNVNMEEFTSKIKDGFAILTDTVIPAIKDGFQWILDHKDLITAGLAGIAGGMAAYTAYSTALQIMQNGWKSLEIVQKASAAAQWLINAAMNANSMMLIVTVITAVIVAIVAFIAKNDEARAKVVEAWNKVKEFVGKAIDAIVKFFTETIPEALDKMITFFKELPGKIWEWLKNAIDKVKTWATNMATKAKDAATKFVNNVVNFVKELPGKVWTWLKNVISKVTSWSTDMAAKAKEAATKFLNNVVNKVKELSNRIWTDLKSVVTKIVTWGSNLASKGKEAAIKLFNAVVDKLKELPNKVLSVGKDLVTGLWDGITDKFSWLTSKIKGFARNVTDKLKSFFGIHSPSRIMRDEVGKELVRGVAVGIEQNTDAATDAMKNLGEEVNKQAKESLAGEYSNAEMLFDKLLGGGKIDKEVAAKINSEILKTAKSKLDAYKKYNKLTAKSESQFWDIIRKEFKEGTEERMEADQLYFEARSSIDKELIDGAKKRFDNYKTYNDMTLAEEAGFWDELRQHFEDGSDARIEADKSYLDAKKSINEKIKSAEEKLVNDLGAIDDRIADRQKDILGSFGLFDKFDAEDDQFDPATQLLLNLDSDIKTMEKYNSTMAGLEKRIGGTALFEELKSMGIDARGNIMQVAKMSDADLQEYVKLFDKRNALAGEMAHDQMKPDTIKDAFAALKEFHSAMDEIGVAPDLANLQTLVDSSFSAITLKVDTTAESIEKFKQAINKFHIAGSAFPTLAAEFAEVGKDSATEFGNALNEKLGAVLSETKIFLRNGLRGLLDLSVSEATKEIVGNIRDNVSSVKNSVAGVRSNLNGTNSGAGTIVKNYTQNIYSPTPANRVTIYRNTKNLLGLA